MANENSLFHISLESTNNNKFDISILKLLKSPDKQMSIKQNSLSKHLKSNHQIFYKHNKQIPAPSIKN